jgi:hypothetical protein
MLLCLLGCSSAARSQSVLMQPPSYSVTPPAVQEEQDEREGTVKTWLSSTIPSPADFLFWGPVTVHPHVDYSVTYGNGIQSQPGQPNTSLVQTFTPAATFVIGNHTTINYAPSFTFYSSQNLHDSFNQSFELNWGTSYEDWIFGVNQTYATSSAPLVQTGTQTSTDDYTTALSASYRFNSLWSIDASVDQSITSAEGFSSSKSWSTLEYLNYQFFPRLTGSVGGGFGYDSVEGGSDTSHESLQLRLSWRPSAKIGLTVHGGAEDRQFLGSGLPNLISPTYGAEIDYALFDYTAVTLSLDRSISPSITSGSQDSESTALNISVNQRLLKRLQLSLTGSYTEVNYLASGAIATPSRTDSYYSFSARLSLTVLRRVALSANYQYSDNSSSAAGFTFASSQVGFDISYGL